MHLDAAHALGCGACIAVVCSGALRACKAEGGTSNIAAVFSCVTIKVWLQEGIALDCQTDTQQSLSDSKGLGIAHHNHATNSAFRMSLLLGLIGQPKDFAPQRDSTAQHHAAQI